VISVTLQMNWSENKREWTDVIKRCTLFDVRYGSDCGVLVYKGTVLASSMQLNYVVVLMVQKLAPSKILERAYHNHVPTLDVTVLTPLTPSGPDIG
jgi:hypothetical protein